MIHVVGTNHPASISRLVLFGRETASCVRSAFINLLDEIISPPRIVIGRITILLEVLAHNILLLGSKLRGHPIGTSPLVAIGVDTTSAGYIAEAPSLVLGWLAETG